MFTVIIPIKDLKYPVLNNVRILAQSKQVKQILLANISSSIIELENNIPHTEVLQQFDLDVYDAISAGIRNHASQKNIILLDSSIQINNNFIVKLTTHYANHHLYSFAKNIINEDNSVLKDNRIGNKLTPDMIDIGSVAFNKEDAIKSECFDDGDIEDFVYRMIDNGVKTKLLNQVIVYKSNGTTELIIPKKRKKISARRRASETQQKDSAPLSRAKKFHWNFDSVYKHRQGKFSFVSNDLKEGIKYSFIIPFMFNGDRWHLFEATIKRLHKLTNDCKSIEIIVHETSPERRLTDEFIKKYNLVYIFNEINILFHRAWSLNVASRYIARGEYLIFMDGDLLVTKDWLDKLYKVEPDKVYVGWDMLLNFSKASTTDYLKHGMFPKRFIRIRRFTHPENGAAAGINIIPRGIFFKVGGWPECFGGSGYGGEDNSMYMKLKAFGYHYTTLNATIYHLFHSHKTAGVTNKKYSKAPVNSYIVNNQRKMKPDDWIEYSLLERNSNWGWCEKLEKSMVKETNAYYNASLINSFIKSKEPLITLCMVNYKRFNTLIEVLERYKKLGVTLNLILYMNDSDNIPENILNKVHKLCKETFFKYEVILDKENHGTAKARNIMLSKAYEEYKTPYVMTTDDDILFTDPESLVVSATVLHQEKYSKYGSVGIGCKPSYFFIQIHEKKFVQIKPVQGFQEVAVLGAATMMIRREVLKDCNTDPKYPRVGFVDWDFSMNITSHGWKIGVVFEDHYQAFNDARGHGNEYNSNRYKKPMIQEAYYRFVKKWGVTPLIAPKWLT